MNGFREVVCNRILPWLWLPVLWVLACRWQPLPQIAIAAPFLALPIAGYLGRRLGRIALVVVGLGCLPFLVSVGNRQFLIGGQPDIFVVALVVCAIAAKGDAWRRWIPDFAPNRWFYGALAVLIYVVSWRAPRWESFYITLKADFVWIYCLLLLLAGFRRVSAWPLFGVVIGASAAGLIVEALVRVATVKPAAPGAEVVEYASSRSPWEVIGFVDYPAALLCAVLYYAVGRNYERMLATRRVGIRSWWRVAVALFVLAVLAAGWRLDRVLFPAEILNARGQHLHVFGEELLLPLAGLCGGLWLRRSGVVLVAVIVAAFWVIAYNVGPGLTASWLGRYHVQLSELVTVIVFGWVGIELRKDAVGTAPVIPTTHWLVFLSTTLAILSEHLLPEEPDSFEQLWPLIGAFAAVVAVVAGIAWWRRRQGWPPKNYAGWIALLALVPLVEVGVQHASTLRKTLKALVGAGQQISERSGELSLVFLLVAFYGWGVVTAVRTALREADEWCHDLLRVLRILARVLGMKSLAEKIERMMPVRKPVGEEKPAPAAAWRERVVRVLGYVQWTLVAIGVVLLAVVIYAAVTAD